MSPLHTVLLRWTSDALHFVLMRAHAFRGKVQPASLVGTSTSPLITRSAPIAYTDNAQDDYKRGR